MLLLSDEEIRQLLPLPDCMAQAVDAVEAAERADGEGRAAVHERTLVTHRPSSGRARNLVVNSAIVEDLGAGLQLFSYGMGGGPAPRERRTRGVTALFAYPTLQMVAMLEDGHVDVVRTGAPTGVAVRHLSDPEANQVAIIGSGELAPGQLAAVCAVRPVKRVRVFSRTPEHRERFASEMSALLQVEVVACSSARQALAGAQIVVTVTNAFQPVIERGWLASGATLVSVAPGEIDAATVLEARLFTSSVDRALNDPSRQPFATLVAERRIGPGDMTELSAVVAGRSPGRTSRDELVAYISTGRSSWDTAIAELTYRRAREAGLGREWL